MMSRMETESFQDVLASLAQTPAKLSHLIEGISVQNLRMKNSADEFSAVEHICHLRDIEVEGYSDRILRLLHEKQPVLPDIDGSWLAIERDYNNQDAAQALEEFVAARTRNVDILRELNPEKLARGGTLEGVGAISLERLLEMMNEHDEEHINELQIIRRRIARAVDSA